MGQCCRNVSDCDRRSIQPTSLLGMSALVLPSFLLLIWYQYTLFAESSMRGTPPVRALFFEFPNEPELFGIDRQFLIGRDILVTPVLEPNATKVTGKPKK